ncbi:MAG: wax ester/triacylglycerol synthase domain-containing protein [Pseudomonadota bacterium]
MRLSEQDASFLYGETASGPLHTASIFVVDGNLAYETVLEHFRARMHLVPRYRQKLAFVPFNLGHPKWVDDTDFAVENHVKPFSVTPGSTLEEAADEILELNGKLLDRNQPLWACYVVDGVPGKTLLLQQVHHAMIDGVSGIDLTMILMDLEPEVAPPPPPEAPWVPEPEPSPLELITEAVRENAETFGEELRRPPPTDEASRGLLANATRAMSRFFSNPAILAPWNAGLVGPKRKMRWSIHPFSEFREIRRAFGGTINDVVLAVISEAAARYLRDHDEDTDGKHLRIMCPVSVRTEDEQGALGNRVSGIFPTLPAWPMDAESRYSAVLAETNAIKENQEAQALTLMNESSMSMPAALMAPTLLVGTSFDPTAFAAQHPGPVLPKLGPRPPFFGFNFTCTNVPGVQVPLYIAGHKLEKFLGILMLGGPLGYGVAIVSYNQQMMFGMIAETRLMPDLENMVAAMEDAFAELLDAARAKNGPAATPPAEIEAPRVQEPEGKASKDKSKAKKSAKKASNPSKGKNAAAKKGAAKKGAAKTKTAANTSAAATPETDPEAPTDKESNNG